MTKINLSDTEWEQAWEYTLGTLPYDERMQFVLRMERSSELRSAVLFLEEKMSPLLESVEPVDVPDSVWRVIQQEIAKEQTSRVVQPQASEVGRLKGMLNNLWLWRVSTGFAVALLAMMLMFEGQASSPTEGEPFVVLVTPERYQPGLILRTQNSQSGVLKALMHLPEPENSVMELWTKADSWEKPISLGTLGSDRQQEIRADAFSSVEENQLFEITLEPPGGSPTGLPTGEILFIGRLTSGH